jgi:hypothetical protein
VVLLRAFSYWIYHTLFRNIRGYSRTIYADTRIHNQWSGELPRQLEWGHTVNRGDVEDDAEETEREIGDDCIDLLKGYNLPRCLLLYTKCLHPSSASKLPTTHPGLSSLGSQSPVSDESPSNKSPFALYLSVLSIFSNVILLYNCPAAPGAYGAPYGASASPLALSWSLTWEPSSLKNAGNASQENAKVDTADVWDTLGDDVTTLNGDLVGCVGWYEVLH